MRTRSAFISIVGSLVVLALGGCTGDTTTGDGPSAGATDTVTLTASPNLVEDDGRFFALTEVGFGPAGYVVLHNFTEVPASTAGLFLCQEDNCVELPDADVEPGSKAAIAVGDGEGLEGVLMTDAELDLQPSDGEISLNASPSLESPDDLRGYLQWGTAEHPGTALALEAGLWIEGSYLNSAPEAQRVFRTDDQRWDWD